MTNTTKTPDTIDIISNVVADIGAARAILSLLALSESSDHEHQEGDISWAALTARDKLDSAKEAMDRLEQDALLLSWTG